MGTPLDFSQLNFKAQWSASVVFKKGAVTLFGVDALYKRTLTDIYDGTFRGKIV